MKIKKLFQYDLYNKAITGIKESCKITNFKDNTGFEFHEVDASVIEAITSDAIQKAPKGIMLCPG
jgi:hypothetical protein